MVWRAANVGYAWEVLNLVFGKDFIRAAYYDYSTFTDSAAFRNNAIFDSELDGFRIGSVSYNTSLTFGMQAVCKIGYKQIITNFLKEYLELKLINSNFNIDGSKPIFLDKLSDTISFGSASPFQENETFSSNLWIMPTLVSKNCLNIDQE
jgi:hypothetical protein